MLHVPLSLLLYASAVPTGGACAQVILVFDVDANVASAAGSTVIVLDAVMVLLQLSTKVHVSV